jgi:3-hydroxyisobutyrate dehydrogenase
MPTSHRSAIASSASAEAAEQEEPHAGDDRLYRSREYGAPIAANLLKAGHQVSGFDIVAGRAEALRTKGGRVAATMAEAAAAGEIVITMLPAGPDVRSVYLGDAGILAHARKDALLIDCSTIDVDTARAVAADAANAGFDMLDAPVSGGVVGAETASLTIMVGGNVEAFVCARPLLAAMGRTIVHAGPSGNGQAAKICNNMILGASMIAVCEAFSLAERLGLAAQTLFDISARSSGQCWALTSYCPVPGPVPASPANRDYTPGFTAAMMLKDLRLAQQAAETSAAATPLGSMAANLYQLFVDEGMGGIDFSGIYRLFETRPRASRQSVISTP